MRHVSDKTLSRIIAAAIVLLLIHQIGSFIVATLGMAWGVVAAAVVAVVSFFSARMARAGARGMLWFLLPMLLFVLLPVVWKVWRAFTDTTSWFERLMDLTPFLIGFGAPVVLLLLAYAGLHARTL